jgi:methionyl aminopeptidase
LKSAREIELMRAAGRIVHQVHEMVRERAVPGVTTGELNEEAERLIAKAGGTPLFKGVTNPHAKFPFPAALCTSINEELVHGIPGDRCLRSGDILSVDCGVRLAGYCGDAATTLAIGRVSDEIRRLLDATRAALDTAMAEMRSGRFWSEVAREIQRVVEGAGFSVVRDFVGHGIGREMHEDPKVPNYWADQQRALDFELVPGMVLAVEPMVNLGGHRVEYGDDGGWVVVTRDRRASAHFEHTLAVTESGVDVLTSG